MLEQQHCIFQNINDRLEVFISSAQSDEGDFSWKELRRKIKDRLQSCPFLHPFIFEDCASSEPSNQRYELQIIKSDVVVLLIKDELRPGTDNEYNLVRKNNKPLLLYFIGESKSPQVQNIKNEINESDFCSYRVIDDLDIDKLDEYIFLAIYSDLINKFKKRKSFQDFSESSAKSINLSGAVNIITTEQIFSYFTTYYNQLYSYYLGEQVDNKDDFVTAMLQWLVLGQNNNLENKFQQFSDSIKEFYSDRKWFNLRWNCFFSYLKGDSSKAIDYAEKAFKNAHTNNLPEWLINNIVLDLRNLASESEDMERYKKYQNLLDENKNILFLPIIDRFASNIYDKLLKDKLKYSIQSEYTISFGGNFQNILKEIENYFFTSIMYGSFTHIYITRKILFNLMYSYGSLFSNGFILFESAKLLLLDFNTKEFNELLKKYWDLLYPVITSRADELWLVTKNFSLVAKQSVRITLVKQLSLYFSDNIYKEIKKFIVTFYNDTNKIYLIEYLDMIWCNCKRLDSNTIIELLLLIEIPYHPSYFSKFIDILFEIDLKSVIKENHINLKNFLKAHITLFAQYQINIQILTYLIDYNKDIYGELELIDGNGLIGVDKKIFNYHFNKKQSELVEAIQEELVSENKKIDEIIKSRKYSMINYLYTLKFLLQKIPENYIDEFHIILENDVFNLIKKVVHSTLPINIKDDAFVLLILLICFSSKLMKNVEELLISLHTEVINDSRIGLKNKKSYSLRKKIIQLLIKKDDIQLYTIQIDYHNFSFIERYVIIETLFYYFSYSREKFENKSYLIGLVLNALNDKHEDIRLLATRALSFYLKKSFNINYFNLLKGKVSDPSDKVRLSLLYICKENFFNSVYADQIIKILRNDLNFEIKKIANSDE